MKNLWLSLKRNSVSAEIYHNDKYIMTISVSEQNRGNVAYIDLLDCDGVSYRIIKNTSLPNDSDESKFNREIYNKSVDVV